MFIKFKHKLKNRLAIWLYRKKCSFKISFAQSGEDIALDSLFGQLRLEPEKINYVEIGTNRPVYNNNTYFLYLKGARGTLVEPNEELAAVIRRHRPEDRLVQAGITNLPSGEYTYFAYEKNKNYDDDWNTFDEQEVHRRAEQLNVHPSRSVKMSMLNINDLLQSCPAVPDLLAIDVEGMDFELVAALDLKKYPIPVIMVETLIADTFCPLSKDMRAKEYLERNGYELFSDTWANMIFYRKEWVGERRKMLLAAKPEPAAGAVCGKASGCSDNVEKWENERKGA